MRKLFLFLIATLFMSQAALAVTFDTLWMKNIRLAGYDECRYASFTPDTTKILVAIDSTIYYLDIQTGNIIDSLENSGGILADRTIFMSLNGKRITSILWDGTAVVWDDSSKRIIKRFEYDTVNYIFDVIATALSPDGRYGLFGVSSLTQTLPHMKIFKLLIYDLNADTIVKWINGTGYTNYIAYAPDGNSFVVSSLWQNGPNEVGMLAKYRVNGWQLDSILENYSTSFYSYLSYSSDSKYLAGVKNDTSVQHYIWDIVADTLYRTYSRDKLGDYYGGIDFSPNNQYLLFGGGGATGPDSLRTQIWDFVNDTSVYHTKIYSASRFEFSNNMNYLLLATHIYIYLLAPDWTKTIVIDLPQEQTKDLYPNPASDFLNINSANMNGKNISIYDMLGNKLMSATAETPETCLNIESLSTGVYLIRIGEVTKMFVK
ncbi:MAG: T9SS type A sorting domain-containing protein [FCB group bacterium]|jgi:WD40 repeat protein